MRKSIVDRGNLNKFLLISSLIAIPDKDIFSLCAKRRNYQNHKSDSESIQQYWTATGNYLRDAMLEIDSQVKKELANDRRGE